MTTYTFYTRDRENNSGPVATVDTSTGKFADVGKAVAAGEIEDIFKESGREVTEENIYRLFYDGEWLYARKGPPGKPEDIPPKKRR